MRLAIIGAGISGLACADQLAAAGHSVTLFDKARGPGGRMSTRRVDTAEGPVSLDHGAQYFTVRDAQFRKQVNGWAAGGVAAPWAEAGPDAWVGLPTMNAPVRHMAAQHDVRFEHHVHGLLRNAEGWQVRIDAGLEGPFDAAVVALPAEQAVPCLGLHDLAMASEAMGARSQPCWTAMVVFEEPLDTPLNHFRETGPISWACRNGAKPGRTGPEAWVVQGSGSWSAAHLEEDAANVAQILLDALTVHASGGKVPPVISLTAHRWRFAMTRGTDKGALWNPALRLGACGDWLLGPRVELAWQSGRMLGSMIVDETAKPRKALQAG